MRIMMKKQGTGDPLRTIIVNSTEEIEYLTEVAFGNGGNEVGEYTIINRGIIYKNAVLNIDGSVDQPAAIEMNLPVGSKLSVINTGDIRGAGGAGGGGANAGDTPAGYGDGLYDPAEPHQAGVPQRYYETRYYWPAHNGGDAIKSNVEVVIENTGTIYGGGGGGAGGYGWYRDSSPGNSYDGSGGGGGAGYSPGGGGSGGHWFTNVFAGNGESGTEFNGGIPGRTRSDKADNIKFKGEVGGAPGTDGGTAVYSDSLDIDGFPFETNGGKGGWSVRSDVGVTIINAGDILGVASDSPS